MNLSGRQRKILPAGEGLTLRDIATDGRVLLSVDNERLGMAFTGADGSNQDLSWFEWSLPRSLSSDGQWILFGENSPPTGSEDAVAIRKIDGSPPINLGSGSAESLSPDGKWVLSFTQRNPPRITLFPVGAGKTQEIPLPDFEHVQLGGQFLPDGKRIVIDGNLPGHAGQSFVVDLQGGAKPRAITPEGSYATTPSPDGKSVVGGATGQPMTVFPVDGGPSRTIPAPSGYVPANWTADSKGLLIYRPGEVPMNIYRLDVATGKMTPLRVLAPPDRTGVVSISPVVGNGEATAFAFGYYQTLSNLFVVAGLK